MLLNKAFCAFSLKGGAIFTATYTTLSCAVFIALVAVHYEISTSYPLTHSERAVVNSLYISFSSLLFMSVVLAVAVVKEVSALLAAWFTLASAVLLHATAALLWLIFAPHLQRQWLEGSGAALLSAHVINTAVVIYCILIVTSFFQWLLHHRQELIAADSLQTETNKRILEWTQYHVSEADQSQQTQSIAKTREPFADDDPVVNSFTLSSWKNSRLSTNSLAQSLAHSRRSLISQESGVQQ